MKTEYLKNNEAGIARAAELLRQGGLVAIPTETVYGLAANALDGKAVARIFEAKGRPQDNPLIVHIAALEQWDGLVSEIPPAARTLAERFWPGPLTIILPKSEQIPEEVSAGLPTVAVRFPSHPVARQVIRQAGVPLAAPSANLSGSPSPTCFEHVRADLDGRVEALLDGGPCGVGVESTVLSLAGEKPRLLRPGGITPEQLEAALGPVEIDPAVTNRLEEGRKAASPGMKYKHYAPKAHVVLLRGTTGAYVDYVNGKNAEGVYALCFEEDRPGLQAPALCYGAAQDGAAQAHLLFDCLRRLDELGARQVYAHAPAPKGVGLAVYNRLIRAAAFEMIDLP